MCSDLLNTFEEIMLLRIGCRYAATIDTEFIILNEIFFFLSQFRQPFHSLLSGERGFVWKKVRWLSRSALSPADRPMSSLSFKLGNGSFLPASTHRHISAWHFSLPLVFISTQEQSRVQHTINCHSEKLEWWRCVWKKNHRITSRNPNVMFVVIKVIYNCACVTSKSVHEIKHCPPRAFVNIKFQHSL